MFKGTIEKRVMQVVRTRIKNAEKEYKDETLRLDDLLEVDIQNLERKCEDDKTALADRLVTSVLNFTA